MNQRHHHGVRAACAAISTITVLLCAPASATSIDFSSLPPSAYESGETLTENGYNMAFVEGAFGAFYGVVSSTATIADADDPATCDIIACPAEADGNYLMVLNDGAVRFSRTTTIGGFRLAGLDLAFLAPVPIPDGNYAQLRLSGTVLNGSVFSTTLDFPGQNATNQFMFGNADIANDFRQLILASLTIDACIFDADANCINSLDFPAANQAQFAIDNLNFNEVPEPGSLLLAGLGFGALVLQRRRQRVQSSQCSVQGA